MSRSDDMIRSLAPFQRRSKVYKEIFEAQGHQFENRDARINDLRLQLSIDTATWGLEIYEKELGIITDRSKTHVERRSVIKSKLRGQGNVNIALIQLVAESFENGTVHVQYGPEDYSYSFDVYRGGDSVFDPPYPIVIRFVDVRGIPSNIDDLKRQIEEIVPAHIRVVYTYRYMTWDEFDAQNLTWDELDALGLTWDEFETGAWIT